jgi:hypothetical protein
MGIWFNTQEEIQEEARKKLQSQNKTKEDTKLATQANAKSDQKVTFNAPIAPTSFNVPNSSIQQVASFGSVSDEIVAATMSNYQIGFESLNKPGYDFFEFYQTIKSTNDESEQTYQMAFNMGRIMDSSITKDKLLNQSSFYLSEILKVHTETSSKGSAKLVELMGQKDTESKSLSNDLGNLKEQMEAIQVQILDRQQKLNEIDGKYQSKLDEVNSKLSANDIAKNALTESIERVKNGLINTKQ